MDALEKDELNHFRRVLAERKERLLEEIRRVLAQSDRERYADLIAGVGDTGDEALADLLRDVAQAEVARDINEVRDINAAEARIAAGTYGACIECGRPIGAKRLEAYPTAKRCIEDQQRREKLRVSPPHPRS
jgi:RNA polymerase-binding protein DksA